MAYLILLLIYSSVAELIFESESLYYIKFLSFILFLFCSFSCGLQLKKSTLGYISALTFLVVLYSIVGLSNFPLKIFYFYYNIIIGIILFHVYLRIDCRGKSIVENGILFIILTVSAIRLFFAFDISYFSSYFEFLHRLSGGEVADLFRLQYGFEFLLLTFVVFLSFRAESTKFQILVAFVALSGLLSLSKVYAPLYSLVLMFLILKLSTKMVVLAFPFLYFSGNYLYQAFSDRYESATDDISSGADRRQQFIDYLISNMSIFGDAGVSASNLYKINGDSRIEVESLVAISELGLFYFIFLALTFLIFKSLLQKKSYNLLFALALWVALGFFNPVFTSLTFAVTVFILLLVLYDKSFPDSKYL